MLICYIKYAILCTDHVNQQILHAHTGLLVLQAAQSPQTTWTTPHPTCLPGARVQPAGI